ncbi:MAG: dephospho-CoA kinase [Rothia sp. (in: high G+C Gram-positive bacteria)]|nr:dephospho-CoA kinase [Rothia sp. (in: high G+C Gram-positive bacteria)]
MKRIGLTGGIGSGKSTVARMLQQRGAVLIDADAISRQLMEPGQQVLAETVRIFGPGILTPSGELDRPALAQLVFSDPEARQKLNSLVHPAVRAEAARQRQAALEQGEQGLVIVEDIPLLVETGQASDFDGVLVVQTDLPVRLERLVRQRGMDEADALARIRAQASDQQRQAVASWLIDNSGAPEKTEQQVQVLWEELVG